MRSQLGGGVFRGTPERQEISPQNGRQGTNGLRQPFRFPTCASAITPDLRIASTAHGDAWIQTPLDLTHSLGGAGPRPACRVRLDVRPGRRCAGARRERVDVRSDRRVFGRLVTHRPGPPRQRESIRLHAMPGCHCHSRTRRVRAPEGHCDALGGGDGPACGPIPTAEASLPTPLPP